MCYWFKVIYSEILNFNNLNLEAQYFGVSFILLYTVSQMFWAKWYFIVPMSQLEYTY